jgi:predicted O-methyltransferase YrrM
MDIVSAKAQAYAEKFSSPEDALLTEIASFTYAHHDDPQMLSGHLQGKFLEMISCLLQPKKILEIGTFMGYSAICLAKGLQKGGKLHTIELSRPDSDIAAENFRRANIADKIILHTGNALEIIPDLSETWDLVFIDADKTNYINYYRLVLPNLRAGGLIIADNVLFHGQVLEDEIKGKNAKAIQGFNEMMQKDDGMQKVMLTIRDGLLLIRKN